MSYAPITQPGQTRLRIWRNTNENPLCGIPSATMHEEEVVGIMVNGVLTEKSLGRTRDMKKTPTDPGMVFELRDPQTDNIIGTTTIGACYAHIYSLGRLMQIEADAATSQGE